MSLKEEKERTHGRFSKKLETWSSLPRSNEKSKDYRQEWYFLEKKMENGWGKE